MKSIWQDTHLPSFPALPGDTKTDVLIIGGGMAGLLTAHSLKEAGVKCMVAEAGTIAGGITGNTTAKITSQHGLIYRSLISRFGADTAGRYLEANEQAVSRFRELCRDLHCDWENQDAFLYSTDNRAALEAELNALQSLRFPAEFRENLPLPFPTLGGVCFPRQGQIHPLKLLDALVPKLHIYEHSRVLELTKHYAVTNRGKIFADSFIVATHFPFLNKHGFYFMKLYQQRSYVLALENVPVFDGMYLGIEKDGLSFRHWGDALLLGGGGHRTGKTGGGWVELEHRAKEYWPEARIIRRWAAQDCMSLDGVPYIGRYGKDTPNLFVATGFNKWGMTSSMVAAGILTDLVQRKSNPYTDIFSPDRTMLCGQLGLNLLESARNLLTPTVPRCPHLGCALKWNAQEHSWDCPCHGSRFTEDGTLLDNPATGDLEKRT